MSFSLVLNNIFFRTGDSNTELLKNINLSFSSGTFTVLRGASGSGKTTLMRLISLNLPPSSGEIYYNGEELGDLSGSKLRILKSLIAYIPETPVFLEHLSLYENLEYILDLEGIPKKIFFDAAMDLLKPPGLISRRYNRVSTLSSTERKLFALTLAAARDPGAVFCDLNLTGLEDEKGIIDILGKFVSQGICVAVTVRGKIEPELPASVIKEMENGGIR